MGRLRERGEVMKRVAGGQGEMEVAISGGPATKRP